MFLLHYLYFKKYIKHERQCFIGISKHREETFLLLFSQYNYDVKFLQCNNLPDFYREES